MLVKIIIVIFIFAVFSLFGMKVMADLDNFMEHDGFTKEKEYKRQALLFGSGKKTKCFRKYMENAGIETVQIEEVTFLKEWKNISYVLAVSESDLDNLSLCNLSRGFYELDYMAAVCNHPENLNLFKKSGIPVRESAEQLLLEFEEKGLEGSVLK